MFGSGLRNEHAFDSLSPMTRTRVRRRRVTLSLVAMGLAIVCVRATPGSAEPSSAPATGANRYVVRPGDTLWSIARRLDPSEDPRRVVDALEQAGLDPDHLVPGQAVVVSADV
jgi:hypothetical protein